MKSLRYIKMPSGLAALLALAGVAGACGAEQPAADGGPVRAGGEVAIGSAAAVATVGLDSVRMQQVLARGAEMPRLRTLLVARHGELLLEHRFRGPALDAPANVKSVSKSVLSAAVGIAIAEGKLAGVEQPIAPFFSRYLAGDPDPRKQQITVGHLLSMQSGLERTSGAQYGRWVSSPNWVRYALARPMVTEPGGPRLYSTGNSHLLSALLTQATGQNTWAYTREKLAEPLGFALPRWPTDPQGIFFGGNEMRMTPRAMLRFGELYRNGGRHEGRQVVPEEWVRASLRPITGARRAGEGYGYGWFVGEVRGHPLFYAWGYGGQFIFVVPDLELTVVTTSDPNVEREREHLLGVRQLLADWIIPAAEVGRNAAGGGSA